MLVVRKKIYSKFLEVLIDALTFLHSDLLIHSLFLISVFDSFSGFFKFSDDIFLVGLDHFF